MSSTTDIGLCSRERLCGLPGCGKAGQEGIVCRGCGEVNYCSDDCYRQHWVSGHKEQCTKVDELLRLFSRTIETDDAKAAEKIADACARAMGNYFSKRLQALHGSPVNFTKFDQRMSTVTATLRPSSKFEEQYHILIEVLNEAERLLQEGKLVCYSDQSYDVNARIRELRSVLFASRGGVLMRDGDSEASSLMFEQSIALVEDTEEISPQAEHIRGLIEFIRATSFDACGKFAEAIQSFESAYVFMQKNCSPDDFQVQGIANSLVNLYRNAGEHEKADFFSQTVVDNYENHSQGKPRLEIGLGIQVLVHGILERLEKEEESAEQKASLMTQYDRFVRKALFHFKGYAATDHDDGPSASPLHSKQQYAQKLYHDLLHDFFVIASVHNRYDFNSDMRELLVENLEDHQNRFAMASLTYTGHAADSPALVKELHFHLLDAYSFLFEYHERRHQFEPPMTEEEKALLAKRKLEQQKLLGYSSEQYEQWYQEVFIDGAKIAGTCFN